MVGDLGEIWKKDAIAYSRFCPGICPGRVGKTAKLRAAFVPSEIRKGYVKNLIIDRCCYVELPVEGIQSSRLSSTF